MIIAYLYERPTTEGEAMGADRTFADYKTTQRMELRALIDSSGLRAGDVLRVRAVSDLGKGRESQRIQNRIAEIGATLEIVPAENAPRTDGRPARVKIPDIETFDLLCGLWYSAAENSHCYKRSGDKLSEPLDRNGFNYLCGPRSGSKAREKRAVMLKRLEK